MTLRADPKLCNVSDERYGRQQVAVLTTLGIWVRLHMSGLHPESCHHSPQNTCTALAQKCHTSLTSYHPLTTCRCPQPSTYRHPECSNGHSASTTCQAGYCAVSGLSVLPFFRSKHTHIGCGGAPGGGCGRCRCVATSNASLGGTTASMSEILPGDEAQMSLQRQLNTAACHVNAQLRCGAL